VAAGGERIMTAQRARPGKPTPAPGGFAAAWNSLFFAAREPELASVLRIGYGVLLLINLAVWLPDVALWFSDDGLLPIGAARAIADEDAPTLLGLVSAAWWPWVCFALLACHAVLLTVGWHTRVQAIAVLIWLTSFQDRNIAIIDGEDTLFRLFAFYLALCPAGWAFSLDARRRARRAALASGSAPIDAPVPWGLRLFQIQMSVIYLSSAIEKSLGQDWISGTALYYVARLDDSFGKFPIPAIVFDQLWLVRLMTWGVLALEWLLPVLLWNRRTRRAALIVGVVFHLAIDYTMNLFLFHWIMILGLLSFAEYGELRAAWGWIVRKIGRQPGASEARARCASP
jgi:hypothetical protein